MIERRHFNIDENGIEIRAEQDTETGKRYIVGYYAVKNSDSVKMTEYINGQLKEFTERIMPEAFDSADMTNVIYTVEHNLNRVIGRTGANTELQVDEKGLFARTEIPTESDSTDEQNNLIKNIQQKIIKGNSFAFRVDKDRWYRDASGELFRDILKIKRIVDITSTLSPAYQETAVLVKRSLNESEIETRSAIDKETLDLNIEIELLNSHF